MNRVVAVDPICLVKNGWEIYLLGERKMQVHMLYIICNTDVFSSHVMRAMSKYLALVPLHDNYAS